MKNIQAFADKTAISLSFICTVHCLALPLIIVMLPSLAIFNLDDEIFQLWMVVAVIPISLYALTMGCKKHKKVGVMGIGAVGLAILIATTWLGHDVLGETGEKFFSVLGAAIIALGHLINHQLCRNSDCNCQT
jgi:hypothetical protein